MEFKKFTLNDIPNIHKYFNYSNNHSCDNTVCMTTMWRDYYDTTYSIFNNTMALNLNYYDYGRCIMFPLGEDVKGFLDEYYNYIKNNNQLFRLCQVTEEQFDFLDKYYDYEKEEFDELADFLYIADELKTLSGRKNHGYKSNLNFFVKNANNFYVKELNEEDANDVKVFLDKFKVENIDRKEDSDSFLEELHKTIEIVDNYKLFDVFGLVLYINDIVSGVSIGEIVNDTLFVSIEKANKDIRGTYQFLMTEFAKKYATDGIIYINREDASGDKGLYKSKMAYNPCKLIKKYVITIRGEK